MLESGPRPNTGRVVMMTMVAAACLSVDAFAVVLGISALANAINGASAPLPARSWLYPAQAAVFLGAPAIALAIAVGRGLDVRYRLRGPRGSAIESALIWWFCAQLMVLLAVAVGVL